MLSNSEALRLAKEFIESYDFNLKHAANKFDSRVNSVKRISVESVKVSKSDSYTENDNYYEITAKGTNISDIKISK